MGRVVVHHRLLFLEFRFIDALKNIVLGTAGHALADTPVLDELPNLGADDLGIRALLPLLHPRF
jgi:hypothetical protein